jgi:hypothetical protein
MGEKTPTLIIIHETYKEHLGHFKVGLKNVDGNITWFGKSPIGRGIERLHGPGKVFMNETHQELKFLLPHLKKEIPLSTQQYDQAMKFGLQSHKEDTKYTAGWNDCADFVQKMYHAAGLPIYFSSLFTRQELAEDLKTDASLKVLAQYGSRDTLPMMLTRIKAFSKEVLAKDLNLPIDLIQESKEVITDEILPVFRILVSDSLFPPITAGKSFSAQQHLEYLDKIQKVWNKMLQAQKRLEQIQKEDGDKIAKRKQEILAEAKQINEKKNSLQQQADQYGAQLEAERQAETNIYFQQMTAQKKAANEGGTIDATHITRQKQALYDAFVHKLMSEQQNKEKVLNEATNELLALSQKVKARQEGFDSLFKEVRDALKKLGPLQDASEISHSLQTIEKNLDQKMERLFKL